MSDPKKLDLFAWNNMVLAFYDESDRGAALLAGSFVEHALAMYLKSKIPGKSLKEKLFKGFGPLATFSQQILIAYAFELISESVYSDLENIRKIRNHFAHHPFETTFTTNEIKQRTANLSLMEDAREGTRKEDVDRIAYLLTCGAVCIRLLPREE